LIRLLELPEAVCRSLREGKITPGHARALLPLGDEREQIAFSERIEKEGLNVRQTEAMVQEMIEQADAEPLAGDGEQRKPRGRRASEHVAALEQDFRSALGVRVKLTHTANGRGKLTIPFTSHEEFERLREHICGTAIPGKG
jgi:ParB family chromosome partitioning protein